MQTPGGGGYGCLQDEDCVTDHQASGVDGRQAFLERGSVFEYRQAQESV